MLEQSLYKQHYGLKANLLVLWVFESHTRQQQFQRMMDSWAAPTARAMLSLSLGHSKSDFETGAPLVTIYNGPWAAGEGRRVGLRLEAGP